MGSLELQMCNLSSRRRAFSMIGGGWRRIALPVCENRHSRSLVAHTAKYSKPQTQLKGYYLVSVVALVTDSL